MRQTYLAVTEKHWLGLRSIPNVGRGEDKLSVPCSHIVSEVVTE